jgi:hypothetical protein
MNLLQLRKTIERHKLYSKCHTVHYENNSRHYFGYKVWLKNSWWFKTAFLVITPVNCPEKVTIVGARSDLDKLEDFAVFLSDYDIKVKEVKIGKT